MAQTKNGRRMGLLQLVDYEGAEKVLAFIDKINSMTKTPFTL